LSIPARLSSRNPPALPAGFAWQEKQLSARIGRIRFSKNSTCAGVSATAGFRAEEEAVARLGGAAGSVVTAIASSVTPVSHVMPQYAFR
jgi:hypothetical protein